jgi:hypothetical protein
MKKKKRGGAREGAGRKKLPDAKQPITSYIEESKIELLGGKDEVKKIIVTAINAEISK